MISSHKDILFIYSIFPTHETVFFLPIHFKVKPCLLPLFLPHSILHLTPTEHSSLPLGHATLWADLSYFASCLWQWCHHLTSYSRSGKYIYIYTHHSTLCPWQTFIRNYSTLFLILNAASESFSRQHFHKHWQPRMCTHEKAPSLSMDLVTCSPCLLWRHIPSQLLQQRLRIDWVYQKCGISWWPKLCVATRQGLTLNYKLRSHMPCK